MKWIAFKVSDEVFEQAVEYAGARDKVGLFASVVLIHNVVPEDRREQALAAARKLNAVP